jgi:uncharacterized alkaline shock family protein YloU
MDDQILEDYNNSGATTIAPEVLLTIIQITARNTPGVHHLSSLPNSMAALFKRGYGEGVGIDIVEDQVYVDLYLVLNREVNIRDVGRRVQVDVARAISEMVGMNVGRVNIHVEDIDYSDMAATNLEDGEKA